MNKDQNRDRRRKRMQKHTKLHQNVLTKTHPILPNPHIDWIATSYYVCAQPNKRGHMWHHQYQWTQKGECQFRYPWSALGCRMDRSSPSDLCYPNYQITLLTNQLESSTGQKAQVKLCRSPPQLTKQKLQFSFLSKSQRSK